MKQDQRDSMRSADDPSAGARTGDGKKGSEGASSSARRRLPFGAGILPETPAASETPKVSAAPEAPVSEPAPRPEPVAPSDEASRPEKKSASLPETNVEDGSVSEEEDEVFEADDEIPEYNLADPPDEPEPDDFDKVPPGPTEEVRFDEDRPPRHRFSRSRRRGTPRRRGAGPADRTRQAAQASRRSTRSVMAIALIVLAVILAAVVAIVLFLKGGAP